MAADAPLLQTWHLFRSRRRRSARRLQPVAAPAATAFHRGLPWLLSALVLTILPLFGQVPAWTLLVFVGCTVWRYWLELAGKPLPSMFARIVVFLPAAYLLLTNRGANSGATGMLTFLIALLSLKVLELRNARDFTIASLLGFFMILATLFYDQSLALCAYLGFIVLVQTVGLLFCHGGLRSVGPTLRLALGLSLQALPLVILLFLVFPRVQGSFLRRFSGGTVGKTGMSDHLQPGSFSALAQSNDPVFRATLTTSPGQGGVSQGQLYWRGAVLDVCDQPLDWRSHPRQQAVPSPQSATGVRQDIQLFSGNQRLLFALDRPTFFKGDYPPDLRAEYLETEVLRSRETLFRAVIYTAYSTLDKGPVQELSDLQRGRCLRLPGDIGPRSRALAESWRQRAHSDDDVLREAAQFFGTNNFLYTLTPGLLPKERPLDSFLFGSRRGFCEHYAAAYCTLMRAANIPARVVVGYQGGEYNRWGRGHYLVRQSDAHAWAEVFLKGRGWVREDPTGLVAPERVSYGAENYSAMGGLSEHLRLERLAQLNAPGSVRWVLRNASQIWDSVDEQWNQLVLGFNQDTQLTLLEKLGLDKLDLLRGTLLTLALAVGILAAGGGVVYLFERRGRRSGDQIQRLYQRFCRHLAARAGLTRLPVEGPLDFARRAAGALPGQATEIRHITDLYVAARYARDGGVGTVAALRAAVGRFRVAPTPS